MAQSIISAGDASNGLATQAGNDGTLVIQSGPAGGKLNAISIAANGVVTMPYNPATAGGLTSGTAQNASNNTAFDFTGIPSWAKRITVMLSGISTNGTDGMTIRLGSGSIDSVGYAATAGSQYGVGTQATSYTTGFGFWPTGGGSASFNVNGTIVFSKLDTNIWTCHGIFSIPNAGHDSISGSKTLSGTLDRLRLTTHNGTDLFDAGSVNIMWE